jgi:hypothetical protein
MRLLVALALSAALSQQYPPAFPRQNATKLLETDRIVVWDIVWPQGQPSPLHRHLFDQVGTYYQSGGRAITPVDGPRRQSTTPVGNISTTRKGTTHVEEGITDPPLRAVFIELKRDTPSAPRAAVSPPSSRSGARQAHVEDRVAAWDFTWPPGDKAQTVRYERDTLVVWLTSGAFRVKTHDGKTEVLNVQPGSFRYHARGTEEGEQLTSGSPRAVIFEFN